jgi:hypothetical protein
MAAKSGAVFHAGTALVAGMFHRSSRYRRAGGIGKDGDGWITFYLTTKDTKEHEGNPEDFHFV